MNKRLRAAEQAGAAGADSAHGRQVGVVEDGQLDGETAPHPETAARHTSGAQLQPLPLGPWAPGPGRAGPGLTAPGS